MGHRIIKKFGSLSSRQTRRYAVERAGLGSRSAGLCHTPAGFVLPLLSDFLFHPAFNPCVCLENKFFIASILQIYASHNVYNHSKHNAALFLLSICNSNDQLPHSQHQLSQCFYFSAETLFLFHFPYRIFTLFQVRRTTCFVTSFISYLHVVFHYRYPQLAAGDSTWQRVTGGHHCVASPSGSDGHTWGREVESG